MFLKAGDLKEAEELYWELLDRNPENCGYYEALENTISPGTQLIFQRRLV